MAAEKTNQLDYYIYTESGDIDDSYLQLDKPPVLLLVYR